MAGNRPSHAKREKRGPPRARRPGPGSGQGRAVRSSREIVWAPSALEDYRWWQERNAPVAKRIEGLIRDILRAPFTGIGKPEPLKANWTGFWSRRITGEHRLVYRVTDTRLEIAQCRYHY